MCQLEGTKRYEVKHYSACYCESIFDEIKSMDFKAEYPPHVGGPHPVN